MKKSSKLFSAILAVMLMVSALGAIPANAVEAEVTVNSLPELEEAIAAAVNGDMIYIAKDIDIQEEVSLASSSCGAKVMAWISMLSRMAAVSSAVMTCSPPLK